MIDFLIYLGIMACIWGILSLSLNLQFGLAGLVNLGHVAYFMVGAYASSILVMFSGFPFPLGMLGGALFAGLFGVVLALPTANLREDYWAISTLAFAEIARLIFLNEPIKGDYIGASYGIPGIPRPLEGLLSGQNFELAYLGIAACTLLLAYLLSEFIFKTPFGRVLKAVREGDEVPLALGKNVRWFRIRAMAVAGGLGGVAGALFAHYNAFVAPNYFLPLETFLVWAMIILGGAGNNRGALLGTVVIVALSNSTRFLDDILPLDASLLGPLRMILIGVLIICIILYLPKGLFPERRRLYGRDAA
ncbi:branched-chain amino acid ABC transporter permease [Desulfohalovibrio reitneri]|uniref:branched-chain amino acid ABC transporter permease n=1 Tax=Desulfohalovibrio reitneri TaxID=1307759 RepID=UPI0004A6FC2E|nr:branched-chain amino acid ABC transporter permease [Desulfohalovibrio reitneri]